MSTVQVLCPNGRRVNTKVSPNTPLLSVLENACQKQGLDPRQHALKHQRKVLDLSQMFRYSGLPNNAKLEVVTSSNYPRKEQPVRVAVQLQSGDRLQGVFPPTVSLWDLMCNLHGNDQWIAGEAIVVYMRREVYGEDKLKETTIRHLGVDSGSVVLRLIHRQQQEGSHLPMDTTEDTSSHSADNMEHGDSLVSCPAGSHDTSFNDLVVSSEHKTLVSSESHHPSSHDPSSHDTAPCYSGSSQPEEPVTTESRDPSATSSHVTISCDPSTSGSHDAATESHDPITTSSHAIISHDPITSGSHDTTTNKLLVTDSTTASSRDPTTSASGSVKSSHDLGLLKGAHEQNSAMQDEGSCDRQVVVFNVSNHSSDATPITELPDNFFDVTVDDCVAMQRDLRQKVKRLTDAPLTTVAIRQATLYERYSQYRKAIIRVQFPDHWVLQGSFQPHESLKALVKFVREHLADPTVKFYLYTTPPKSILTNGKLTLLEAGLVPASIVHFALHDSKGGVAFLKSSLLEEATSPSQADVITMATRDNPVCISESPMEISSSNTMETTTNATYTTDTRHNREKGSVNKTSKAVPKWFKHSGGKKL